MGISGTKPSDFSSDKNLSLKEEEMVGLISVFLMAAALIGATVEHTLLKPRFDRKNAHGQLRLASFIRNKKSQLTPLIFICLGMLTYAAAGFVQASPYDLPGEHKILPWFVGLIIALVLTPAFKRHPDDSTTVVVWKCLLVGASIVVILVCTLKLGYNSGADLGRFIALTIR
jgi:hypothetical protein